MKILIVGGTGLTGAHAALYLSAQGHQVTLLSRSQPTPPSPVAHFPHIQGDYIEDTVETDAIKGFDAMVFAAGSDIRQLPLDMDEETFFHQANTIAIPRFFEKAKTAGISRVVYIGTYYPQMVPEKIATSSYVRSRHLADTAIRAMSNQDFCVCSLNAPFIIGHVPGLHVSHLEALVHYAAGRFEDMPVVAPEGGVNHISSDSLSEAILSALENGQSGKAYLVGDENILWKDYLADFFEAAGNPQVLAVSDQEHPMFPDIMLYAGRGATVFYEPEFGEIRYSQKRIQETIKNVVEAYL